MRNLLVRMVSAAMAVTILFTTGCSAFRPYKETVSVTCIPNDAILMVNGQRYNSPAQVSADRNRDVSIQCNKEGYVPYQRTIGNHFNTTGVLDAIGTVFFLVPGIGLFFPGAWSLDETNVFITLYKNQ